MTKPVRAAAWATALAVLCLGALFVPGAYTLYRLDAFLADALAAEHGYYYEMAGYQHAFVEMREELRLLAMGADVAREEVALRADVLASRASILLEPSELVERYRHFDSFAEDVRLISEFQRRVGPTLSQPALNPHDAVQLLEAFNQMAVPLSRLTNGARNAELADREETLSAFFERRAVLWGLMLVVWGTLAVWVLVFYRNSRRSQALAHERLRALESERAAVAAMQAAVVARNEFLAMVSHELRSPLQSILSALLPLGRRAANQEDRVFISRIRRSATALEVQLRDLLTLAQGEAGAIELRPEPFDACGLVREVLDLYRENAQEKGLALILSVPDEPIFVMADASRIGQVLGNLIGNAIKYTERGTVSVTLSPHQPQTGELRFDIVDTGPGMPAEWLGDLFVAYRRHGTQRGEGSGLGLAIVKTIVQHLGGEVRAESAVGQGSRFFLRIPATPLADDAIEPRARHVLIVDDTEDVLNALATIVAELGYTCDTASSAAAAANHLAACRYDAILLDLDMPVKRGEVLAGEIRKGGGPNASTRLIAISAAGVSSGARDDAFDAFLQKPVAGIHAVQRVICEPAPE